MSSSWNKRVIILVVALLVAPILLSSRAQTGASAQTTTEEAVGTPQSGEKYAQLDDSISSPLRPKDEVGQASILDQAGYYGAVALADSSSAAGVTCFYDQRNGASYVDVAPRTAEIWGFYYYLYQLVAAEITVFEEQSDGSVELVGSSGVYTGTVSYYESVLLDVPDIRLPIGLNYYVVYDFEWYYPGTTALDGYRTYFVDYYKSYYYADSGNTQGSITSACKPPQTSKTTVALDKEKSKYNGWVTASLRGFTPNSSVTLHWPRDYEATSGPNDGELTTLLASGATDASGAVTLRFRTPLEPLGDYTVTARDGSGKRATATLRVIPRIMLNEERGPRDTRLRVYFYGFGPGETIEVRWHATDSTSSSSTVVKRITVEGNGRASTLVAIPTNAKVGDHRIVGKVVGVSRSASTTFTLTAGVTAAEEGTPSPSATPGRGMPTATPMPANAATEEPSTVETATPTIEPTVMPAESPTIEPTAEPTGELTEEPTPTSEPAPTETPPDAGSDPSTDS